jgi:hypothetical protein
MEKKQGSGDTARALIRRGAKDEETLELVRFLHPDGRTTLKTVQSYRSRMRDDYEDVPVGRDAPGIDRACLRELIVTGARPAPEDEGNDPEARSARQIARESIRAWRTNQQTLEDVLSTLPGCGFTPRQVTDTRMRLRAADERIPTDNEVRRWQAGEPWTADLTPPPGLRPPS